ncbi:hypothetical protein SRABI03_02574 [Microbacterium foliorum]|nr:hypothetical protein SRABI03_02574 [Microbacterium foliorum]
MLLVAFGREGGELGIGELADGVEDGLAFFGGGGDGGHGHRGSLREVSRDQCMVGITKLAPSRMPAEGQRLVTVLVFV